MALSLGAQGDYYLEPHEWLVGVSYRYLHSFRDFHFSEEIPVPSPPALYANTHVHSWDVTVGYAVTKRFSLTLELPFQYATRETYNVDGLLQTYRSGGLGDIRLIGNFWLLDPNKHANENVSLALGVKAPTGDSGATDNDNRAAGTVSRPVDPAIQLGDGGWGIILGVQAFKTVFKNTSAYLQGNYLISPREMNGTQTPWGDTPAATGGDIGYTINTVPDQYIGRGGFIYTIWPKVGLSVSLGALINGLPAHDFIGGDEGYRVPGYAIYIEPGFSISRGKNFFSLTAPVAIERHADLAIADIRTGSPIGGYAAFADFLITASYSRRF